MAPPGSTSLMLNSYLVVLVALLQRGQPTGLPQLPYHLLAIRADPARQAGQAVASAGALYAFIISQWRKSKGREDERHLKRGYDNLHHHIKSKMDEVSGERPPGV